MKRHCTAWLLPILLGIAAIAHADAPAYDIRPTKAAPVIDGVLDDAAWRGVPRQAGFVTLSSGTVPTKRTSFQLTYDHENLYIGVKCYVSDPDVIAAGRAEHDGNIWNTDAVEIWLDVWHDHWRYFQFAVNAFGVRYNARAGRAGDLWNEPWQAQTATGRNYWTLEAAIPFSSLGVRPPERGVWGLNICRSRPTTGDREMSSWAPMAGTFHDPSRFGHLAFGGAETDDLPHPGTPLVTGVELVDSADPTQWRGTVKLNTTVPTVSGNPCYELSYIDVDGRSVITEIESEMIPVDANKSYWLSCVMRSLDGDNPASGWFGLRMYDAQKRPITLANLQFTEGSETRLAEPAAQGARELWIENNPKWEKRGTAVGRVAFNIQDDYEDLPNMELSGQIDDIFEEGARRKVVLREPLRADYPAGTRVRLHGPYTATLYWVGGGWMPTEWRRWSVFIGGEAPLGIPMTSFWRGTRYVRVFASFSNYNAVPEPGAVLLVDDLRFVEN